MKFLVNQDAFGKIPIRTAKNAFNKGVVMPVIHVEVAYVLR